MDEIERQIRRKLRDDFTHYSTKCLKIRSKGGEIRPFILNQAQRYIHDKVEQQRRETGRVRAIVLKGRQQGCSTYIEGRFYWLVTHRFGVRAFILTHDNDATNNLFEMAQRYHEHCPGSVRPTIEASNAKELIFAGLDSGYKLGTAGNKAVGRSSTIQLLHGSEVAYWPNASEHAKGILQAVPNDANTEVFIESTANGIGNYFHEQWQLAESKQSDFIAIFVPWFWQDEYRRIPNEDFKTSEEEDALVNLYGLNIEQLSWRRSKITELSAGGLDGIKSFMQEYPCTPIEAFIMSGEDSFITPDIVERARKTQVEKIGKLIIGCDTATSGNDRTAIIRRRTRCSYGLQTFCKKSPTEITNILHRIIIEENPDLVVLDGSPAGGGAEVRDRLWQLGHKSIVISALSSETPFDQIKYFNKRAEMWGEAKAALLDYPCQIPDSDELAADLCGVRLRNDDIHQRIKLEKKEDMKKRGIRSPDCGDAYALTYARPEAAMTETHNKIYESIAKDMGSSFNNIDRLKKKAYG
jgi:hypothetical protein